MELLFYLSSKNGLQQTDLFIVIYCLGTGCTALHHCVVHVVVDMWLMCAVDRFITRQRSLVRCTTSTWCVRMAVEVCMSRARRVKTEPRSSSPRRYQHTHAHTYTLIATQTVVSGHFPGSLD